MHLMELLVFNFEAVIYMQSKISANTILFVHRYRITPVFFKQKLM
jgi:hypothetical protein